MITTVEAVAGALTAAGHTRYTLGNPATGPRFTAFNRDGTVVIDLSYPAGPPERAAVQAQYVAALAAAGLGATIRDDGYIHVVALIANRGERQFYTGKADGYARAETWPYVLTHSLTPPGRTSGDYQSAYRLGFSAVRGRKVRELTAAGQLDAGDYGQHRALIKAAPRTHNDHGQCPWCVAADQAGRDLATS